MAVIYLVVKNDQIINTCVHWSGKTMGDGSSGIMGAYFIFMHGGGGRTKQKELYAVCIHLATPPTGRPSIKHPSKQARRCPPQSSTRDLQPHPHLSRELQAHRHQIKTRRPHPTAADTIKTNMTPKSPPSQSHKPFNQNQPTDRSINESAHQQNHPIKTTGPTN